MFLFKSTEKAADDFRPAKPTDSSDALQRRIESLTDDELHAYQWMRECYTRRWIGETLLLDKRQTRALIRSVCGKLGVRNANALLRIYSHMERPGAAAGVDTIAIDRYVDDRPGRPDQNK
jgi:DNA-binding CsgD family transcriptional regulator